MTSRKNKRPTSERSEPNCPNPVAHVFPHPAELRLRTVLEMLEYLIREARQDMRWTSPSPGSAPPATQAGSLPPQARLLQAAVAPAKPVAEKRGRGRGRAPTMKSELGACGTPGHAIYGSLVCSKCGLDRRSAPSLPRRKR